MSAYLETEAPVLHGTEQSTGLEVHGRGDSIIIDGQSLVEKCLDLLQDAMDQPLLLCIQRFLYSTVLGDISLDPDEFLTQLSRIRPNSSASSSQRGFNWLSFLGSPVPWRDLGQKILISFCTGETIKLVVNDCARLLEAHPGIVADILGGDDTSATAPVGSNSRRPRPHAILFKKALLRLPFSLNEIAGNESGEQCSQPKKFIFVVALTVSWCWFRTLFEESIKERNAVKNKLAS